MSPQKPEDRRRRRRSEAEEDLEGDHTLDYFEISEPWRPDSQLPKPGVPAVKPDSDDRAGPPPAPDDDSADIEAAPDPRDSEAPARPSPEPPAAEPEAEPEPERREAPPPTRPDAPAPPPPMPPPLAVRASPLDPTKVLPRGWRFLEDLDVGLVGAFWNAREPNAGFPRAVKVLGRGEQAGTTSPSSEAGDALKPHILPWQKRAIRTANAYLLVSARQPPPRVFVPREERALVELHAIAAALVRCHKYRYSLNFLAPRGIGIEESNRGPNPVFVDFGLSIRATMAEIRKGRVSSPALSPETVAYWAPEVVRRLDLHKPASGFHPQADSYFLAVAVVELLWGGLPWDAGTWDGALAGHEFLPEAIDSLDLGAPRTRLLRACVDPDPRKRLGVHNFVSMLQTPDRREKLWGQRRVGGGVLGSSFDGHVEWSAGAAASGGLPDTSVGVPGSALDETLLDPFSGAEGKEGPSRRERRARRKAKRVAQKARAPKPARDGPRHSVRTTAWYTLATAAALAIALAASGSGLLRRSPGLARAFGAPLHWPDLASERESLVAEQSALLGKAMAPGVRRGLEEVAAVAAYSRQCDEIWLDAIPRWRQAPASQARSLSESIALFADRVEQVAEKVRASRAASGSSRVLRNDRFREHVRAARVFNARQAARVAAAQANGHPVGAAAMQPVWTPTRLLETNAADRVMERALARAHLLRGTLLVPIGSRLEAAQQHLARAYSLDDDLLEALLEEARAVARSGRPYDKERLGKRLEVAFEAFQKRHFRPDRKNSARLVRVGELYQQVLRLILTSGR